MIKDTIKIEKHKTKMIAHRGLSGLEKENTMAAFIAAGARSYFGIECDIHPTIDKKYAVVHDDDLIRLADNEAVVRNTKLNDLQKIYLIDNFDHIKKAHLVIPSLEQYIANCIKYQKICVIEYKHLFTTDDLYKVVDIVQSYNYLENTIFISFIMENLINIRKKHSTIKLQFLTNKFDEDIFEKCKTYKLDYDVQFAALTKEIISRFHKAGLEVNCWVVDKPDDAKRLIDWDVDYITTNILE